MAQGHSVVDNRVHLGRLDEARWLVFAQARHSTCKSSATSSLWRCVSVLAKTDFN